MYALLADGTTVEIRPAAAGDFDGVRAMHEAMSPNNSYLRFFNLSKQAARREAQRIANSNQPGQVALLALAGTEVIGVASYNIDCGQRDRAEVAFAVADHMHHRGVATLLLEHLVSRARRQGITTLTAQTLTENKAMLEVFAAAGLPVRRRYVDGVYQLSFPLGEGAAPDSYLDAVAEREGLADAASLRHVLAPESVVVIGASRRRGNAGRAIADNIRAGGYRGRLYTVNPHAGQVGGEHCLGSVLDLPEPADLAVIAVPAPAVLDAVDQCGRRGVRSVVVIASGLDAAGCADLLAACRRHGMRLLGPDSFGVAVPGLGLDATFAASHPAPGAVGLVMQSGGLGFAAVQHLSRLGIGISSFASVGRKLDVSGNDMLLWWEHDGVTKLAVLYLDSFGNPRKFARTARRAAARMPVLTVQAGRSAATQALFEQAGVITTSGFGELIEATALLATQPVPSGTTVALVTNVGSAGELAADACRALGLTVHHPHGQTINELRALVPQTGSVTGPVDMTATVSGDRFRRCLGLLAAAPDVHAIIAIVLPTAATGDLVSAIGQADLPVPCAAVVLSQPESVRLLPGGRIPGYGYPEAAVAAVARAAGYGAWRAEPRGRIPDFADIKPAQARALAREFLGHQPEGGWLPAPAAAALLGCYGIPGEAGVSVRVSTDRTFGPLLTASGKNAGQAVRLIPLTDTDADKLVRDVGGQAPLRELLLRVSRLADDLPEVTDLNLSVGRVRVAPYQPKDPFLRRLR